MANSLLAALVGMLGVAYEPRINPIVKVDTRAALPNRVIFRGRLFLGGALVNEDVLKIKC